MSKQKINVKDFDLFHEVMKAASKILDSAKFIISENGLEIYGARDTIARCELVSNAVSSDSRIEFSIEKMSMFLKIVSSVCELHDHDYSKLSFYADLPFVRFESKKIKTKYSTCNEAVISKWVSKKIQTEMTPVFEFTSNSDFIRRLNSHSFMFNDPKDVRVYLETKPDMENNAVFATLGNREVNLNNDITLKFALVNSGSLVIKDENGLVTGERSIILDLERLNMFNAVPSQNIKFQLMNLNCVVSKTSISGKDGSFFDLTIYSTKLKA